MLDKIQRAYYEMLNAPYSWMGFAHRLSPVVIFHDQKSKEHLTENAEFDSWVHKGDIGYPTSPSSFLSPDFDTKARAMKLHTEYMLHQHNQNLADTHDKNLSPDDLDHVHKLVYGGLDYSSETGSRDINSFLWNAHKAGDPPPTHFTREGNEYINTDHVNLTNIDHALKKNQFDEMFHSFHGLGFNPMDHMTNEKSLFLPAYTSGSVNRSVAVKYASFDPNKEKHILHMIHPPGSKGMYLGNTSFFDNEVLLPRHITVRIQGGAKYDVHGTPVNVWVGHRFKQAEGS